MTDKQKYICFDCKHHTCKEEWHGEEEFIFSECMLGHETSPIWEIKCEDFNMTDKQMEEIIKMYTEPSIEIKFPIVMQGLNETYDEYRKRVMEYMEQQNDR